MAFNSSGTEERPLRFPLTSRRRQVWMVSAVCVLLSVLGIVRSWTDPQIGLPLRPGLDFTGGTQIQLERSCADSCDQLRSIAVEDALQQIELPPQEGKPAPKLENARVQLLDRGQSIVLRMPALSAGQGQAVIEAIEPVAGPFEPGGQSVDTIGPSLGGQLLSWSFAFTIRAYLAKRA